jgi:hypothetical protein
MSQWAVATVAVGDLLLMVRVGVMVGEVIGLDIMAVLITALMLATTLLQWFTLHHR